MTPEVEALSKRRNDGVIYGWSEQEAPPVLNVEAARGIHLWTRDGRRYADFASGQININVGYGHPRVLGAIAQQLERAAYVAPNFATDVRSRLASMIAERTPGQLDYVFFTNTGAEGIEAAVKVARRVTGRSKIYSASRSYHGASAVASAASGDPRRLYGEPAAPAMVKFHYPACYSCAFGHRDETTCQAACLRSLEAQIQLDGPETVAAILMEPIVGTSGGYVPPSWFLKGVRQLCDRHGILLVFDETMTGWGRTGRWFASEHSDVTPDILVTAKGLTSGYVPLGAVVVTPEIQAFFGRTPFVAGSTTEGHALACAAGAANLEAYQEEGLIERSATLGDRMLARLNEMKSHHACVGDVRGQGLFSCIELTRDKALRLPLAGYRNAHRDAASTILRLLRDRGIIVLAKWDFIFLAPPLTIEAHELDEALEHVDETLSLIDDMV